MKTEEAAAGMPDQAIGKRFGVRAVAQIIDWFACSALVYVAGFVVGVLVGLVLFLLGRAVEYDDAKLASMSFYVGLLLFFLYFAVFEWLYGASLGKIVLKMRVVQENGRPCGFKAAIIRGLLRYLDGAFFAVPAYLMMKRPLFQRMGDKVAKTLVVSSKNPMIRDRRSGWWFLVAACLYFMLAVSVQMLEEIASLR